MKELESDMQDAIRKHLPAQLGTELQKLLTEREELIKNIEDLQGRHNNAQNYIKELQTENEELKKLNLSKKNLELKEKFLEDKERKLENEILKIRLEESEKRADISKDFVGMVFKSPVYRKSTNNMYSHMTDLRYDNQGLCNQHSYKTGEMNEETISEE